MKKLCCCLAFCLFYLPELLAQQYRVKGVVRDGATQTPLPFVSIQINEGQGGAASDISGRFDIKNNLPVKQLTFSYVGYETQTLVISGQEKELEVLLLAKNSSFREVVIRAGYNPAHRIIKLASQNRERNDPGELPQFTYRVYNKTYAAFASEQQEEINNRKSKRGHKQQQKSNTSQDRDLFADSHLFLSESLADHAFMKPDLHQETVLGTRISGWKNPQLAILATNSQEFSIYKDLVSFFGKSYVSPLSKGSTQFYDFQLQDTAYVGEDSVFIISYQPKTNRNFQGLQGQLHISSRSWATVNVIAESADPNAMKTRLQQQYAEVSGQKWFPVEANIETVVPMPGGQLISAFSRSSFSNFETSAHLRRRDFKAITLKINDDAGSQTEAFWQLHRPDSLTAKELRTYVVVDSINTAVGFDQSKMLEVIFTKQLPIGPISVDADRFLKFNEYEDTRVGAGLHTNNKISRLFSVGGYAGYGFRDKGWKYGSDLKINLHQPSNLSLKVAYAEEVTESAGIELPFQEMALLNTNYRALKVWNMDKVTRQSAFLTTRTLKYLDLQLGLQQDFKRTTNGYSFQLNPETQTSNFHFTEAILGFRYAFREQLMQLFRTNYSLGTKYPTMWFQYRQGFNNWLNGEFAYHKYNARLSYTLKTKMLGTSTLMLDGGLVKGNVPYPNLFNGNGSTYYLYSTEGFQTMGMNEFLMNRYAALYLNHNLGTLLYQSKKFSPSLAVVTNVGFGSLNNPEQHQHIKFKTMNKGFFESGLQVNNLYSYRKFYSLGAGVFYRYGAYQRSNMIDNFALRITTSVNL